MKWHNAQRRIFLSLRKLKKDTSGATAIEYGFIVALIALGLITALGALSGSLETLFSEVSTVAEDNTADTNGGTS